QSGETPTTPKYSKDCKESFFPSTPNTVTTTALTSTTPSTVVPENPRPSDLQSKTKLSHSAQEDLQGAEVTPMLTPRDIEPQTAGPTETLSSLSYLTQDDDSDEPLEGLSYRHQETHLCHQMKMATVASSHDSSHWQEEGTYTQQDEGTHPAHCSGHTSSSIHEPSTTSTSQSCKGDGSRIKSRVPPNMPKLFIPSSVAKFPPEITVTPPTPTLLSPKGSVSEETKQKLKTAILSAQSAANVKKETLCQPALEILETSSQESSLESDSDDEEDDYMDI
ncbi:hypothetical protein scyTo_0016394, partial [Scyliorhinus torazame]|nr:hypothetical protein [Scyliorhinus torazame]